MEAIASRVNAELSRLAGLQLSEPDRKAGGSILSEMLAAAGRLDTQEVKALAVKVTGAMHAIKAEKCSTRLVMELARHFREAAADHLPVSAPPRMNTLSPSAPEGPATATHRAANTSKRTPDSPYHRADSARTLSSR